MVIERRIKQTQIIKLKVDKMVEQAWLDKGDVIIPEEAHENFLRLIEFEKDA